MWALALLFLIPTAWFLLSSFKPGSELFTWPLRLFPEDWTFSGYRAAWERFDFKTYFLNTAFVAVVTTVFTVFVRACRCFAIAMCCTRRVQAMYLCILASNALTNE